MSILLSVNPPFAGMLVDGEKTIEWRKKPLPDGKAYIYETKKNGGCGMVIGEVYIGSTKGVPKELLGSRREALTYLLGKGYSDRVITASIAQTNYFILSGNVSKKDLAKYAKGHKAIYANDCWDFKRYDKPIGVTVFLNPCGQNGCICCPQFDWGKHDCKKYKVRPPQSWCYVDDLKGGEDNGKT